MVENKEQAILKAAEEEFLEKGYDGAKTMSIANRAGVTHAMLHYYFRTKQNLFEKVLNEKIRLIADSIIGAFVVPCATFEERIKRAVEAHFDFLVKNPDLPRFVVNEVVSNEERLEWVKTKVRAFYEQYGTKFQKEIDEKVKNKEMHPITILDLVLDIVSINLFIFVSFPIYRDMIGLCYESEAAFFAARKEESVKMIMDRLFVKNKWY